MIFILKKKFLIPFLKKKLYNVQERFHAMTQEKNNFFGIINFRVKERMLICHTVPNQYLLCEFK